MAGDEKENAAGEDGDGRESLRRRIDQKKAATAASTIYVKMAACKFWFGTFWTLP